MLFMYKVICQLLLITFCWSCSSDSTTAKYQSKRENIINVHDQIKGISIENVLISNFALMQIIDKYLFITDYKSANELIHIFNKSDFKYVASTALKGQGPGEITNIGHIAEDKAHRKFYVSDHGKNKIFSFDIDSAIADPAYLPIEKMKMGEDVFPDRYVYINDTLSIAITIHRLSSHDFLPVIGKLNMRSREITPMPYTINPKVKKKRITFAVSLKDSIYVECYAPHDLMTICSLDGDLKYNVYGPKWDTETHGKDFFGPVIFCGNRIVALYSGERSFTKERKSNLPTQFVVFDLEGNYLKTLETGYKIANICYDESNHRIIMNMNDTMQFTYLDVGTLLD